MGRGKRVSYGDGSVYIFFFHFYLSYSPSPIRKMQSGKPHKTGASVHSTVDDASCFLDIRLGPQTSHGEKNVTVVSTVTRCEVTDCATTLQGFIKHASSRRETVSDSRGVPRCTQKISKNLHLLTCVEHSTCPIHQTFCLELVFITRFHRASYQENSSQ